MPRSTLRSFLLAAGVVAVTSLVPIHTASASSRPSLTVTGASVREGDAGRTNLVFTVRLHHATGRRVTVGYFTVAGTASAPSDFIRTTGTLTFRGTTVSRRVAVPVVGDRRVEPNETFRLRLSGSDGATIETGSVPGVILNDDELLSVAVDGPGSGTITSDPAGVSCTSACSRVFAMGTVVSLQQQSSTGSEFAGWSGFCAGSEQCSVTMSGPRSVGAGFALLPLETLGVVWSPGGTISTSDGTISCGATCQTSYPQGTSVTLTETPSDGWQFAGWNDQAGGAGCAGSGTTCTVDLQSDDTVTPYFLRLISVAVAGPGKVFLGAQQVCPDPITGATTCQVAAPASDSRSFVAVSDVTGVFQQWSGACGATSTFTTCVVDPGGPTSIAAIFNMKPPPGP